MKNITLLIIALLCILAQSQLEKTSQLKKVIMLFRHGARYPNHNDKDPVYNTALTKSKSGALSPVGMRQLFQLGQQIRQEYIDTAKFLKDSFDPKEMYLRATDSERTMQSAQSFMTGLYPAGENNKIDDSIMNDEEKKKKFLEPPFTTHVPQINGKYSIQNGAQTFPVRTVQNDYDSSLFIHGNACSKYESWRKESISSKQFSDFRTQFDKEFNEFEKIFGVHKFKAATSTLETLYNWEDVLLCNEWNNYPEFDKESQSYYSNEELRHRVQGIVMLQFHLIFFQNELQRKVIPTPFLNDLNKYLSDAHKQKFTVLSAHDTTINTVLSGLGLVNADCIIEYIKNGMKPVNNGKVCITEETKFASNIIFELREQDSKQYIMIRYNGEYLKICDQTSTACLLSDFQDRIKKSTVTNYDEVCGNIKTSNKNNETTVDVTESDSSSEEVPAWTIAIMSVFGVCFAFSFVAAIYFFQKARSIQNNMRINNEVKIPV